MKSGGEYLQDEPRNVWAFPHWQEALTQMDGSDYPECRRLRSDAELVNRTSMSTEQDHELGRNGICLSDKIQVQEELLRDLGLMEGCVRGQLTEVLKQKKV